MIKNLECILVDMLMKKELLVLFVSNFVFT